MLNAEKQRLAVGRKLTAADFCADGSAHEALQSSAFRSVGGARPATVIRTVGLNTIGDDPEVAVAIESQIIR